MKKGLFVSCLRGVVLCVLAASVAFANGDQDAQENHRLSLLERFTQQAFYQRMLQRGLISHEEYTDLTSTSEAPPNELELHGLFQVWYISSDELTDDFKLRRGELKLKGAFFENVGFFVQADSAKGAVTLQDLALTLRVLNHTFTIGQFKRPTTLEGSKQSASTLELMERASSVRDLGGTRDRGAKVEGNIDSLKLTYILGIFSGEGANNKDTNEEKDLAGMLIFKPIDPLAFYLSAYEGSQGLNADPQDMRSIGARFEQGPWVLRGEYVEGQDYDVEKEGWYVLTAYRLSALDIQALEDIRIAARYEQWDNNLSADGFENIYTIGVQYFLDEREYQKFSLDYILFDGKDSEEDSQGVTYGFQIKF